MRQSLQKQHKPKLQELATFTNQLANLLKCGMPLTVALNSMTHLETKGIPAEVSRQLKQDVMEGKGLSEAMAKQKVIFSDLYVNMVQGWRAERGAGGGVAPHGGPFRAVLRGAGQGHFRADLSGLCCLRGHCHLHFLHDGDAAQFFEAV